MHTIFLCMFASFMALFWDGLFRRNFMKAWMSALMAIIIAAVGHSVSSNKTKPSTANNCTCQQSPKELK